VLTHSNILFASLVSPVGAKSVNPDDVIKLAERYRGYVNGVDDAVGKVVSKAKAAPVGALEDMTDDIPY
jgi:hypothetical protein